MIINTGSLRAGRNQRNIIIFFFNFLPNQTTINDLLFIVSSIPSRAGANTHIHSLTAKNLVITLQCKNKFRGSSANTRSATLEFKDKRVSVNAI